MVMGAPQQGDLGLLDDAAAQQLLSSAAPAHLAYTWSDGTPRNTPIWFHWNGRSVVMCSPSNAPKVKTLTDGMPVAVTIHGDAWPYAALLLRGSVADATPAAGTQRGSLRSRKARVSGIES